MCMARSRHRRRTKVNITIHHGNSSKIGKLIGPLPPPEGVTFSEAATETKECPGQQAAETRISADDASAPQMMMPAMPPQGYMGPVLQMPAMYPQQTMPFPMQQVPGNMAPLPPPHRRTWRRCLRPCQCPHPT